MIFCDISKPAPSEVREVVSSSGSLCRPAAAFTQSVRSVDRPVAPVWGAFLLNSNDGVHRALALLLRPTLSSRFALRDDIYVSVLPEPYMILHAIVGSTDQLAATKQ